MAEQSSRMEWPYPTAETNPWYQIFESFVAALDASGYATREDRQLIMAEGGTVSWDLGTETFSFDGTILLTAPITGFLWQVQAGNFVLTNGQVLYVTLNRGPGSNTALTAQVGNTVPSDDDALILAIRINSSIYLRTGLVLGDGDSVSGVSPGSGGGGSITVREQDATPTVANVTEIRVPNGSLTDEGGGAVSITFPSSLTVQEQDATPTVVGVTEIRVSNGTLTDEGGGAVSLDLGAAAVPVHFQQNGPLASVTTPTDFVDGLREVGVAGTITGVVLSQEIDGGGGTTDVELYKVDPAGTETQITVPGAVALAAGGGPKARILAASFIGTNNELVATDRLGIKLTTVQTGAAADVTVTVLLGGVSAGAVPGLAEDNEVTQALLRTVVGTTFENVGTIYLPAGTILSADSRVFMGVDNISDVAELEIRDAVTSTLIDTISATGLPADTQPGANIIIPTDGWYSLRLRADTALVQATLFGLKFVYAVSGGTRIRQAIDAEVTGTTWENVGSVYLPAGTLQAPGRIFAGASTVGPDAAEIELRRETGGTLIATWTATGTLQEVTVAATGIPADDWYHVRLRGNGVGVVALLKGVDWTVLV